MKRHRTSSRSSSRPSSAVQFLKSRNPKTLSKEQLSQCLTEIESFSFRHGLPPDQIQYMLDLVCSKSLVGKDNTKVMKLLIPQTVVPTVATKTALFCVIDRSTTSATKVILLKWVTSVWQHDLLEDRDELHCLYDLLFAQLDVPLICPYICFILHELTRKTDVVTFRINFLESAINDKFGPHPHFVALWNHYSVFKPKIVKRIEGKSRYPQNSLWDNAFLEAIHRNKGIDISPKQRKTKPGLTEIAACSIKTCEELQEVIESAKNYMSVPDIISSPLGRLILSSPDNELQLCLQFWISSELNHAWYSSNPSKSEIKPFKLLHKIASLLPHMLQNVTDFFCDHIEEWDNLKMWREVLNLLPFLAPCSLDKMIFILETLHRQFLSMPLNFQILIIQQLSKLFSNWIIFGQDNDNDELDIQLELQDCIKRLGQHIDTLLIVCIQLNPSHETVIMDLALDHYSQLFQFNIYDKCNVILLPSPLIVSHMLFSLSIYVLSRSMEVFLLIRELLTFLKTSGMPPEDLNAHIGYYNECITDIIGALCNEKAFKARPNSYLFKKELSRFAQVVDASSTFTIYRHPALLTFTFGFLYDCDTLSHVMDFRNNIEAKRALVRYFETSCKLETFTLFLKHYYSPLK